MIYEIDPVLRLKIEPRFNQSYTKQANGCWLWNKAIDNYGYGVFFVRRPKDKAVKAHRVAWMLWQGPLRKTELVCHDCDTPACVNPRHLWLGTHEQNMRDMVTKKRSGHSGIQLGKQAANSIRYKYCNWDITQKELAVMYNVSIKAISRVLKDITWS